MRREHLKGLLEVEVPVMFLREGDYMVAYCPALELSSYGRTLEAAKKAFAGAMKIFIEETEKKGTLEKELLSLGWSLQQKPSCRYQPPFFVPARMSSSRQLKTVGYETLRIPCDPPKKVSVHAGIR